MASAWGEAWAQAFGDAWGSISDVEQPAGKPRQDSVKWGYGPMVMPKKIEIGKTRQQLQNEAILLTLLM